MVQHLPTDLGTNTQLSPKIQSNIAHFQKSTRDTALKAPIPGLHIPTLSCFVLFIGKGEKKKKSQPRAQEH